LTVSFTDKKITPTEGGRRKESEKGKTMRRGERTNYQVRGEIDIVQLSLERDAGRKLRFNTGRGRM